MNVVALVTARGNSKSIPGKNLATVAGKPLIAWTIEAARRAAGVGRVVVSTDDDRIASVARQWHAETPFRRPAELAEDDSPHIDVMLHAVRWLEEHEGCKPDYMLLLQPTSPLRTTEDVEAVIRIASETDVDGVVSVCPVHDHPYLTKRITDDGLLANLVDSGIAYLRRQDLPPAYCLNGALYLMKREALLEQKTFNPARMAPYVMPRERSLDIDDPWDLHVIDRMLSGNGEQRSAA